MPASGTITMVHCNIFGRVSVNAVLLNAAVSTSDGEWVDISGLRPITIHVSGITGAKTLQIRGSNAVTKPENTEHAIQIGSDISSDNIYSIDQPLKWLKVRVSNYSGSGAVTANMTGEGGAR